MWDFSLENGIDTVSWWAEFALRSRVSRSAMGSVMVMGLQPSLAGVSVPPAGAGGTDLPTSCSWLPAALGHAGELATVGHLPHADPAQAELAVHRVGAATALAARVPTHRELRLRGGLVLQSGL